MSLNFSCGSVLSSLLAQGPSCVALAWHKARGSTPFGVTKISSFPPLLLPFPCVCASFLSLCAAALLPLCCLAALKNHPLQQKLLELAPSLMKLSFFPLLSFPIPFRKLAFSPPPPSPPLLLSPPLLDPPPSSFSKALLSQNWKNRKKVVCLTFFFDPRFESTGSFSPYLHRITSQIALGVMSQRGAIGEYS